MSIYCWADTYYIYIRTNIYIYYIYTATNSHSYLKRWRILLNFTNASRTEFYICMYVVYMLKINMQIHSSHSCKRSVTTNLTVNWYRYEIMCTATVTNLHQLQRLLVFPHWFHFLYAF